MTNTKVALFAAALLATPFLAPAPARADERPIGLIFFTEWSALLDPPARQVILEAKAVITRTQSGLVTVTGYADTTGSKEANDLLSKLRAQMVVDLLIEDGVPPARLQRADRGATPDIGGANESRRVVISIASE